ncbi:MAG TPA: coproporphyrinogen III oxidase, partial [Saprospiraceae bacterium]|nr:coproporphyrinogen III oxidase [Saprospiraceae bacterium]
MVHSGIYIHIPYCKRKCTYCNFHFSTQFNTLKALLEALHTEIMNRALEIPDILVDTIYFGG